MADEGEVSALVCDNGSGMVKVRERPQIWAHPETCSFRSRSGRGDAPLRPRRSVRIEDCDASRERTPPSETYREIERAVASRGGRPVTSRSTRSTSRSTARGHRTSRLFFPLRLSSHFSALNRPPTTTPPSPNPLSTSPSPRPLPNTGRFRRGRRPARRLSLHRRSPAPPGRDGGHGPEGCVRR